MQRTNTCNKPNRRHAREQISLEFFIRHHRRKSSSPANWMMLMQTSARLDLTLPARQPLSLTFTAESLFSSSTANNDSSSGSHLLTCVSQRRNSRRIAPSTAYSRAGNNSQVARYKDTLRVF